MKQLTSVLYREGKFEKCSQLLREILTVEVENIGLRNQLASIYFDFGKYNPALIQLPWSRKFNPRQPGVYGLAGRTLLKLGKPAEAERTLINAINLDQRNEAEYEDL